MRAPWNTAARRRRRGAVIALAMTVAAVLGWSTGAVAAPLATGSVSARAVSVTEYRLGALVFAGKGTSGTSTVGNGGSLVLAGAWRVKWWGKQAPARYSLQRKVGGGSWKGTTAKVSLTDNGLVARTPAWSTKAVKATVRYRLRSSAYTDATTGGVRNTSTSDVVKITYENQKRYTGLAKQIYDDAKPYCPNTAVHVTSLQDRAGDYQTGTLLIRAVPDIASYEPIHLRSVALHECSHQRQWLNYGGTNAGHDRMEKAAARIFADYGSGDAPLAGDITPVEHAADCGAQSLNPGGYLGYGGSCTDEQLQAGKRLLLGKKY
jgi:hypothetical protein